MVTRIRKQDAAKRGRKVKVDELKLNKETVKDLSASQQKQIEGGRAIPKTMPPDECYCLTHIHSCVLITQLDCM